jgi:hypothetical protein
LVSCFNNGTCLEGYALNYTCMCTEGYTGSQCEQDIDDCASNPCANGSTCLDEIADYTCLCLPGYTGGNCSTNIDDCASNPCANGSTCLDEIARLYLPMFAWIHWRKLQY